MLSRDKAIEITTEAAEECRRVFPGLIDSVYLYGSYSRGDFDEESDIDIFVALNCTKEKADTLRHQFSVISSELSLKYEITVSLCATPSETFDRYSDTLPYYINILKEGVKVA